MLTRGGLPEAQALHWNDETRQQLGQIVFMLVAGEAKKAQQAYIKFYELKRRFFAYEFDRYIEELDEFRVRRKFRSLSLMIWEAGEQIIRHGQVADVEIQPPNLPEYVPTPAPPTTIHHESVEQMSLF